ncbi:MAG: hypothetical protein RID59_09575 [Hoeflea sp.]
MVFDDIIIGSGLSALAVALGLPQRRRILVFAGPVDGRLVEYAHIRGVPCQYLGHGGLGNYWHGVIPSPAAVAANHADGRDFAALFAKFYPDAAKQLDPDAPALFVPRSPIRPRPHWNRLLKSRDMTIVPAMVSAVEFAGTGASVEADGRRYRAQRVWCCAGALGTARLLTHSFGESLSTGFVSDHVIISLGLVLREAGTAPVVRRGADGYVMKPLRNGEIDALLVSRPARFGFARLDGGIERRAIFGLPTKSILGRLMKAPDPGLVSEALFNKFGLFPKAARYNLYAQLRVRDAYTLEPSAERITARPEVIYEATDRVREAAASLVPSLEPSRRPDLYIPGIHLHRTIDQGAAQAAGIGVADSPLRLSDASVLDEIGSAHHSFGMMVSSWNDARTAE